MKKEILDMKHKLGSMEASQQQLLLHVQAQTKLIETLLHKKSIPERSIDTTPLQDISSNASTSIVSSQLLQFNQESVLTEETSLSPS